MIERMRDRLVTLIFTVAVALLTVTFSIGLPIYVRAFYYAQLPMVQDSVEYLTDVRVDEEVIVEAYDDVMDYLTLPGREFSTGRLPFSESGKAHFEDCKVLFDLNRNVLIVSLAVVVILLVWHKCGIIRLVRMRGFSPTFWAGVGTLATCLVLALLIAPNFEVAFTVFHKLFFPGKTNWVFNPITDPVVLFLPTEFFMNCAILIGSSLVAVSMIHIIIGAIRRNRKI